MQVERRERRAGKDKWGSGCVAERACIARDTAGGPFKCSAAPAPPSPPTPTCAHPCRRCESRSRASSRCRSPTSSLWPCSHVLHPPRIAAGATRCSRLVAQSEARILSRCASNSFLVITPSSWSSLHAASLCFALAAIASACSPLMLDSRRRADAQGTRPSTGHQVHATRPCHKSSLLTSSQSWEPSAFESVSRPKLDPHTTFGYGALSIPYGGVVIRPCAVSRTQHSRTASKVTDSKRLHRNSWIVSVLTIG